MKNFNDFISERKSSAENKGLYDRMTDLLNKANILSCQYDGDNPDEYEIPDPDTAIEILEDIDTDEARELIDEIQSLVDEIDESDAEDYYK